MKLNKNVFARYYEWIYGNLPNDVCSFFWGSLFAIGTFYFLVPGRLMVNSRDGVVGQFFTGVIAWLGYGACVAVGFAIVKGFGYEFINLWGFLLLGALIGAGVIAVVIALIVGTVYVTTEKLPETTVAQNTKDWVGAIRKQHCTKITWNE